MADRSGPRDFHFRRAYPAGSTISPRCIQRRLSRVTIWLRWRHRGEIGELDPALFLQQRPEIVQPIEQLPDIARGSALPMAVQVGQRRIGHVAVECLARAPLDQDQDLAALEITGDAVQQAPKRHDPPPRSEEHTSELQSRGHLVCRLLLEKKKTNTN